jgi:hypothetical protein
MIPHKAYILALILLIIVHLPAAPTQGAATIDVVTTLRTTYLPSVNLSTDQMISAQATEAITIAPLKVVTTTFITKLRPAIDTERTSAQIQPVVAVLAEEIYKQLATHETCTTFATNVLSHCAAHLREQAVLHRATPNRAAIQTGEQMEAAAPQQTEPTCTVTSRNNSGAGTLRSCLTNPQMGLRIQFSPQTFPTDTLTSIEVTTPLPSITTAGITIDASDAGVLLSGRLLQAGNGLEIDGANQVTIRGLTIVFFPDDGLLLFNGASQNVIGGDRSIGAGPLGQGNLITGNGLAGIRLEGSNTTENHILGNYIGPDLDGAGIVPCLGSQLPAPPCQLVGVVLNFGATFNRIGGDTPTTRNLISRNAGFGVALFAPETQQNRIQGNLIGVNAAGDTAAGNGLYGVYLFGGAQQNQIGGPGVEGFNLISGNSETGIVLEGVGTHLNHIVNNSIGTALNGLDPISESSVTGIWIDSQASENVIGGNDASERNIISNHLGVGVFISGTNTISNTVAGNYIGVAADGTTRLGNGYSGVFIAYDSHGNTIGPGNALSANGAFGVLIDASANNRVIGNFIGTNSAGAEDLGNDFVGVAVTLGATQNVIGGSGPGEGNLISGNAGRGIQLEGSATAGNRVIGNRIGTNADGAAALANGDVGVAIAFGATQNIIGGSGPGEGNLISGNGRNGIQIQNAETSGNLVLGNRIGTDRSGQFRVGNHGNGISILDSSQNQIGGDLPGATNLISGNSYSGIIISGTVASDNQVLGNLIGVNISGTTVISNTDDGIYITGGAQHNLIGGTTPAARNLISGNGLNGIEIIGPDVSHNQVLGNYLGTDASGTQILGRSSWGIYIENGVTDTIIGGSTTGARNLISGHTLGGILLAGPHVTGTHILGNFIGVNITGDKAVPNAQGVILTDGPTGNFIGGEQPGEGNLISGNDSFGVGLQRAGTEANQILGNLIGTDVTGTKPLGNGKIGVIFNSGAKKNILGGTTPGARNIISANRDFGIQIQTRQSQDNIVLGNYIGTDISGTTSLGNGSYGVTLFYAGYNTIGGEAPGAGNLISGNGKIGIAMSGSDTISNTIAGNIIGPDVSGSIALDGQEFGITIDTGARYNLIGGATLGARNLVSGNTDAGIHIQEPDTAYNRIIGNYIGVAANGHSPLGNGIDGIRLLGGAQHNIIGGVTPGAGNLISGNGVAGVRIQGDAVDLTAYNQVMGNIIGADATGEQAVGNLEFGILISSGAMTNTVGGEAPGTGNLISDNELSGVLILGQDTRGNQVLGNLIGLNYTGEHTLGQQQDGVRLEAGATNNLIGGLTPAARNIISGHDGETYSGVWITGAGTNENRIIGNYIGVDASGKRTIPNDLGVNIVGGARRNRIGGAEPGAGNLISGNRIGVGVEGADTIDNRIQGNLIGPDDTGLAAPTGSVQRQGVTLTHCATANLLGGDTPGSRNVISANSAIGIVVQNSCSVGNRIIGNYIGVDADGIQSLGNGIGILISFGANSTVIGGESPAQQNLISGNLYDGVVIQNLPVPSDGSIAFSEGRAPAASGNNQLIGNRIGSDSSGQAPLPNGGAGVLLFGAAQGNRIGISNTIAFNLAAGVTISDVTSTGNTITRNTFYQNDGPPIDWLNIPVQIANSGTITLTRYSSATNTLQGQTCNDCRVEVYATGDANLETLVYLGSTTAATDGTFTLVLSRPPSLPYLFATVTLTDGTTTQFAGGLDIRQPSQPPPTDYRLFLPHISK